jgi:hypothetical protein
MSVFMRIAEFCLWLLVGLVKFLAYLLFAVNVILFGLIALMILGPFLLMDTRVFLPTANSLPTNQPPWDRGPFQL